MRTIDERDRAGALLRLFLTVGLLVPPIALAQTKDVAIPMKGDTEIGGFIGSSYGLDSWRVMGGGNFAYAVHKVVMPYVEYSYFPGIQRQLTTPSGSANFSVALSDIHGGVHIRIPLGQSPVVPYVVAGAGTILYQDAPVKITFPDGFTLNDTIKGSSSFAANFGGGLRFYTKERVGFRFEAKVYKPTGTYTTPFYKVEAGVFFLIRSGH